MVALIPLERMLSARRSAAGRPAKDRAALSIAFAAKAVLNLPTTRDLIDRLRVDETLRRGYVAGRALRRCRMSRSFPGHLPNLPKPNCRSNCMPR